MILTRKHGLFNNHSCHGPLTRLRYRLVRRPSVSFFLRCHVWSHCGHRVERRVEERVMDQLRLALERPEYPEDRL